MATKQHDWACWSELRVGDPAAQYAFWETLAKRQGWTVDVVCPLAGEAKASTSASVEMPTETRMRRDSKAFMDLSSL